MIIKYIIRILNGSAAQNYVTKPGVSLVSVTAISVIYLCRCSQITKREMLQQLQKKRFQGEIFEHVTPASQENIIDSISHPQHHTETSILALLRIFALNIVKRSFMFFASELNRLCNFSSN